MLFLYSFAKRLCGRVVQVVRRVVTSTTNNASALMGHLFCPSAPTLHSEIGRPAVTQLTSIPQITAPGLKTLQTAT
jgi:hypothetical protein